MRLASLILAIVGFFSCGRIEKPRKVNELSQGDVALHLIVSNQSFDIDPVDIDVYIDGVHVITGDFDVGSQHTFYSFDFSTTVGAHSLRAIGDDQNVTIEQSFDVPSETWGVLMFWFYETTEGGADASSKSLEWHTQQTQPMFD